MLNTSIGLKSAIDKSVEIVLFAEVLSIVLFCSCFFFGFSLSKDRFRYTQIYQSIWIDVCKANAVIPRASYSISIWDADYSKQTSTGESQYTNDPRVLIKHVILGYMYVMFDSICSIIDTQCVIHLQFCVYIATTTACNIRVCVCVYVYVMLSKITCLVIVFSVRVYHKSSLNFYLNVIK